MKRQETAIGNGSLVLVSGFAAPHELKTPIRTLADFDASRFEDDYPSGLVVIINPPSGPSCLNCRGEALAS